MSRPLLSVCIPHIGEPWLHDCMASVEAQGLERWPNLAGETYAVELIVECDLDRNGAGATRNRAIERATGEYLMCMDADDLLPPDTLEPMLNLAAPELIVATSRVQFFDADGPRHRWTWYEHLLEPFNLLTMPHSPLGTGNVIYHRSLHDEIGGFPEDCGGYESWAFFARAVLADYSYVLAPGTEYLHRLHPDSYWSTRPDHRADLQAALMHVYAERLLG